MSDELHNLAAGVVIVENDRIVLVRDKHGWGLPKGSVEQGELIQETARREAKEETGLGVRLNDVAFIAEYRSSQYGRYLQVYYHASVQDVHLVNQDPDHDIEEVLFVPKASVRDYIKFKPWILPLEDWIMESITKYHSFDLDIEGYYL